MQKVSPVSRNTVPIAEQNCCERALTIMIYGLKSQRRLNLFVLLYRLIKDIKVIRSFLVGLLTDFIHCRENEAIYLLGLKPCMPLIVK